MVLLQDKAFGWFFSTNRSLGFCKGVGFCNMGDICAPRPGSIHSGPIRIQQLNLKRIHANPDSDLHPTLIGEIGLFFLNIAQKGWLPWLICESLEIHHQPKLAGSPKPSKLSAAVYHGSMQSFKYLTILKISNVSQRPRWIVSTRPLIYW